MRLWSNAPLNAQGTCIEARLQSWLQGCMFSHCDRHATKRLPVPLSLQKQIYNWVPLKTGENITKKSWTEPSASVNPVDQVEGTRQKCLKPVAHWWVSRKNWWWHSMLSRHGEVVPVATIVQTADPWACLSSRIFHSMAWSTVCFGDACEVKTFRHWLKNINKNIYIYDIRILYYIMIIYLCMLFYGFVWPDLFH